MCLLIIGTIPGSTPFRLYKLYLQNKGRNKVPMNCIAPTSCWPYQKEYQKCCEQKSKRYRPTRPLQYFDIFVKIKLKTSFKDYRWLNSYLRTVDHIPIPSTTVETSLKMGVFIIKMVRIRLLSRLIFSKAMLVEFY